MTKIAVIGVAGESASFKVQKFNKTGETVEAQSVHFEFGGKGFNQAVAASRFGAEVSFLCALGNDDNAAKIKIFLKNEKIDEHCCIKDEQTAFASIITDTNGDNQVTVFQGAELTESDVINFTEKIAECDILLLSNEVPERINIAAAKIAKTHSKTIILNPAPKRKLSKELIQYIDLFTPNETEFDEVCNQKNVVVTLGDNGCKIISSGKNIESVKVKAVNTTGAGDTFNGVLAVKLAEGASLEDSCRAANLAAAISVTRNYAVSSIPYKFEIDEFKTK